MWQEQKSSPVPGNGGLSWGQNETHSSSEASPKHRDHYPRPLQNTGVALTFPLWGRRGCYSTTSMWTPTQGVELLISPVLPVMKALSSRVSKPRNSLGAALCKGRAQSWQPSLPRTALLTRGESWAQHTTIPGLVPCSSVSVVTGEP